MNNKKYSKRISFGYDSEGKRIRHYFYYDNKSDLNRQIEEYKQKIKISTDFSQISFLSYASRWLETFKKNKQPATYNMYSHYIAMSNSIHNAPLCLISITDLQEIINENIKHPRTCHLLALTWSNVFNMAKLEGKIDRNPAEGLDLPKYKPKEKRVLTDTEKEAIENADFTAREKLYVDLLLTYGMRPSEALALNYEDFTKENLTINKNLGFDKHLSFIKQTKTGDIRVLPMTKKITEDLKELSRESRIETGLVFRDKFSKQMSKTSADDFKKACMAKIMDKQGFDSKLTAYIFRHNKVTELIYSGVMTGKISVKMVAKLVGNSEKMVMEVYSHIIEEQEDVSSLYN